MMMMTVAAIAVMVLGKYSVCCYLDPLSIRLDLPGAPSKGRARQVPSCLGLARALPRGAGLEALMYFLVGYYRGRDSSEYLFEAHLSCMIL